MRFIPLLVCAVSLLFGTPALAQQYPGKPIKFIVTFSAGSSIDTLSRVVLDEVHRKTGAVVIVEYKPGALGVIGMDYVAKAAPDGYTLMASSSATHSSGPQLARSTPYDALKDFTHLTAIDRFDLVLVTNAASGIKTVDQLIAEARKKKLNYGYGSATGQVGASAVSRAMGAETEGIPYKGQPLAVTDLIGGHLNFVMSDVPSVAPHVKAGKLNALGISSDRRSTILPDVPTLNERGVKVELVGWVGFAGPAGLPEEVRAWWAKNVGEALANPAVIEKYRGLGVEPFSLSGEPFQQFVQQQYAVWGRHIKEAGITPQ